jgi:ubiquinone/menaquinone biosynthesis C-methylase UbiE
MSGDELVRLQKTLYESRNATRRWLHNARREWIVAAIREFCPHGTLALEIGPGSGIYVPVLKEMCTQVYVADCEEAYLRALQARYSDDASVHLVVDDITKSHLPSDTFDLVLCTEVVEHIANSPAAIMAIARVLKSGGILVLSTPQRYSLLELTAKLALSPQLIWLTRLLYREPVLELGHINLMTERQLQAQLAAAKLRILRHHKAGLYLPGVAEFCGAFGQRLAATLEPSVRGSRLAGILWTQYYVATRELATGCTTEPAPYPAALASPANCGKSRLKN